MKVFGGMVTPFDKVTGLKVLRRTWTKFDSNQKTGATVSYHEHTETSTVKPLRLTHETIQLWHLG